MVNVVLVFHGVRNDNLGVGALTASEVEILRAIADRTNIRLRITIIDAVGPRPSYIIGDDITVENIRVFRQPHRVFNVLRDADIIVDIGAGDSFTDIYGRKRLIALFFLKFMAHLLDRPLVVAPQTIGPFRNPISRMLAAMTLRRSAIVATRDALSTDCARELGVGGEIVEASDVALRLPFTPQSRVGDGPIKVGINVSGLLINGGYTGKNMFGLQLDYRKLIVDIIERFLVHPAGCEVHLVPHVISWSGEGIEDDMSACRQLKELYPSTIVAPTFETPSSAKTYISGLDFFLGARMHSCIAAFSSGVPVVPMAYSRKFAGLFGSLGYNYTVDCTSDTHESIVEDIFDAFSRRAEASKELETALTLGLEKLALYESALEKLIVKKKP